MGNFTSNSTCEVKSLDITLGVCYLPLFFLGFFVNVAALRAFISIWRSWKDTHIYMFNLAIADFTLVLFLPFRIYDSFICLPKTRFCTVLLSIHFINMYASIMTTMAISVQRYLIIRFPLLAKSWRKKKETAFAVCLMFWVLLVTICYAFREENYTDKLWTCYERRKDQPLKDEFFWILLLLGFLIPLVIIVFCSSQIISILSKEDEESEEKKIMTDIVKTNMTVFIVCFTPIHIAFILNYLTKPPPDWEKTLPPVHIYFVVSEWIATTNCCFDCISCYFLLKQFYSVPRACVSFFESLK